MVCKWTAYFKEKLLFHSISAKSILLLPGFLLLLLKGCIATSSGIGESPYHGPYLTSEGVFVIKEIEGSASEGTANESNWYMGQFDFSGHLEQSVDITPFMGSGSGRCIFLAGTGTKLLYEFSGSHGTVYMIYDSFMKIAEVLDINYDNQQFAFSDDGSSLWIIRRENKGSFWGYVTHFTEVTLTSMDTVSSFEKEGEWYGTSKVWKSGREMLCSRGDSLFSVSLITGFEDYLDVTGLGFTSFGDDGIVALGANHRLTIMKKENVTIDTLYTYVADGSYSSISFSDDGLFMAYKAHDGFGHYIGLWDWEDQDTHELRF